MPALAALVASWVAVAFAPTVAPAAAPDAERVEVRSADGGRTVEGTVLVESLDGGLLLERPDDRLELLQPESIVSRTTIDPPAADETPREWGRRILGELPPGFDLLVTKHYVICFDTSRAYAQWCGALFERLHDAFGNFWRQAGFPLTDARRPLTVVIFSDRRRYEAVATRDLGTATDRVVGYYNLMSNRVTTFDLTGSDMLGPKTGKSAGRAGLEILARPEAAGLVATLVHEATHQMAFNCGMHRRLAPVPLWVSEGIATYFETPDLGNDRGWRGIGGVNKPRLERFLQCPRPAAVEGIVLGDEPFRQADAAIDSYARAWALTSFLVQTRKEAFVSYLRMLADKEPLADDSPDQREREFAAAFGATPAEMEEPLLKYVTRLSAETARRAARAAE